MNQAIIGVDEHNKEFVMDVDTLVESRLLGCANSGGGKSWLLRRILEQTHGKIQQIIIDLEGEFTSLREKHDYLIVGKDADIEIDLKISSMLPKKLLDAGISTIIDISELKQHERRIFVKRFLESLMQLPRKYWKPLLVVLDETHQFSPEKGKAESSPAVIDLMTRGRKRGYTGLLATQRLSKLSKDASAECNNVLIGRTGQDIDMKRAADILGFSSKQDTLALRTLEPGTFYAFGPAFPPGVNLIKVGNVETNHPKIGSKSIDYAPKPTAYVQKILDQLKDIQVDAVKELKELEDYKSEVTKLRTELTRVKKGTDEELIKRKALNEGYKKAMDEVKLAQHMKKSGFEAKIVYEPDKALIKDMTTARDLLNKHLGKPREKPRTRSLIPEEKYQTRTEPSKGIEFGDFKGSINLRPGAQRMLQAAAMFSSEGITKAQMSFISGISIKGGSFSSYLSNLRTADYIIDEGGKIHVTATGIEAAGEVPKKPKGAELVDFWCQKLRPGAQRMLRAVVEAYPNEISKETISELSGVSISGGSFSSYLSNLKTNNLIIVNRSMVKAHPDLMMK